MGVHLEQWWAQFLEASDRFDTAYLVEGLSDLIGPHIKATSVADWADIVAYAIGALLAFLVWRYSPVNQPEAL